MATVYGQAAIIEFSQTQSPLNYAPSLKFTSGPFRSGSGTDTINTSFTLPKFDSQLGVLNSVAIRLETHADSVFQATVQPSTLTDVGVSAKLDTVLTFSLSGSSTVSQSFYFNQSGDFTRTEQTVTFDYPAKTADSSYLVLPSSDNSFYEGTGNVTIPLRTQFLYDAAVSNNQMSYQYFAVYGTKLSVQYEFTAIPEPPSSSMQMAVGLIAFLTFSKKVYRRFPNKC